LALGVILHGILPQVSAQKIVEILDSLLTRV
jgi:hypothetical protein